MSTRTYLFGLITRHVHDWTKWKEVGRGPIREGLPPLAQMFTKDARWHTVGEWVKQWRECTSCGKSQTYVEYAE